MTSWPSTIWGAPWQCPPLLSQHLAKLQMARLVRTRRDGTHVFYRVENDHVARLVRDAVFKAEHAGLTCRGITKTR